MSANQDYEWYVLPPKNDDGSFKDVAGRVGWLVMYSDGSFKNLVTGNSGNIIGGGSSASLDVLDDGSTVLSPAEALNLDGGYFDVTDAGNGQADATFQPGNVQHNELASISKGDHRTDEQIEDLVAALLVAGAGINVTYDDGAGTLQVAIPTSGIDDTQIDEAASFAWTGAHDFTGGDIEVPDPTQNNEAATKEYVDATSQGLQGKDAVVVATDGTNIDLTATTDPNPIDGVTLLNGERILLKDQLDGTENGIYEAVDASDPSTWVRSSDMDSDAEVEPGVYVFVEAGTANGDTGWFITNDSVTLGTTDITWSVFARAGEISAGDNLEKVGSTINFLPGTVDPNDLNNVEWTALLEGPISERPSTGNAPVDAKFYDTDNDILYRNDSSNGWVAAGTGTQSQPVPGTSYHEAISTDQLTLGAGTWEEDDNSPLIINSETGDSISLAKNYDIVKVLVVSSGAAVDVDMQVNGDTGSNYDFVLEDGTTGATGTEWPDILKADIAAGSTITLTGNNADAIGMQVESVNMFRSSRTSHGTNLNVSTPLDSIRLFSADSSTFSLTAHVYGFDV